MTASFRRFRSVFCAPDRFSLKTPSKVSSFRAWRPKYFLNWSASISPIEKGDVSTLSLGKHLAQQTTC